MPDVNTLLDMAIKEADNLFDGEEFCLWQNRNRANGKIEV